MTNYEKLKQMTFDEMESEIKCLVRWLKPMPNTEIDYCVLKYLMSETRETNKRKIAVLWYRFLQRKRKRNNKMEYQGG